MGVACDQSAAKGGFKPLNMLADSGLANAEPFGSKGKTAGLLEHDETGKMLKVQHYLKS
ncbi:hypothetical protein AGR2A_Lc80181 [Agrobacterium genomosp. 2 str. CFBP 5494]|uniref:Uncharacterized protein n=2 Tax=Agrobacterium TaxID=357 RepID=U4Q0E0_9HYPH|nr:protein of unknown function [Agrobacterium pusense]CUX00289.1 hypothetical protein AGR2A_Lc80181 [Agrobacterium genomosp. 2 str. CFBP 5494]